MKGEVEVPRDAQVIAALPTKGASEEEMKCCFFPIKRADWVVIVVTLQLTLFSLQNVSDIKSIHE
jgi:hypothetical protein